VPSLTDTLADLEVHTVPWSFGPTRGDPWLVAERLVSLHEELADVAEELEATFVCDRERVDGACGHDDARSDRRARNQPARVELRTATASGLGAFGLEDATEEWQ